MKKCIICKIEKEISEFSKNRKTKDKLNSICRICLSNRTKSWRKNNKQKTKNYNSRSYKKQRIWVENNKERNYQRKRNSVLLIRYGITLEDYDTLLLKQNNKCALCHLDLSGDTRNTFVDHDHETGNVRGLIHGKCNTLLGLSNDNITILLDAIEYLKVNRGLSVHRE